jgi:hypothetical protein
MYLGRSADGTRHRVSNPFFLGGPPNSPTVLPSGAGKLPLDPTETKDSHSFGATTYLLWSSNLANSIYVPLGSVAWKFSRTATNSGTSSVPHWTATGRGSAGSFSASKYTAPDYDHPTWGNVASTTCNNM